MIWEHIQGWFDFQDVYERAIADAQDGDMLVEVGCWKGKSLCFLLEKAKESGKRLYITGIDHFRGSVGERNICQEAAEKKIGKELFTNCQNTGYRFRIGEGSSIEWSNKVDDRSINFVFLDGSHDEKSVLADVAAWLPKVKIGGVLAGHDYWRMFLTLQKLFGEVSYVPPNSWRIEVTADTQKCCKFPHRAIAQHI